MAQIIPAGWRQLAAEGGVRRELQTLSVLERELPDSYTVYHGVHWTRVDGRHSIFGEVDFVILNAAGKILLVEQKSGMLSETADGLFKRYGDKTKSVRVQMARTADQLQYKFSQDGKAGKVLIELLLYCPHYEVKNPAAAGIDPERIVDSQKRPFLGHIIRNILPDEAADPAAHERVHKFLVGELDLVADVSVLAGDAGCLYRRMSGGLATWARQIECEPQRLRIVGTAGSGKTQLALAVFQDALDGGKRPLYVCFNRPLADHIARIVGGRGVVSTYHQLCDRMLTAAGRKPHFDMPDAFARMEHQFAALDPDAASLFDVLIVDEGQDFSEPWRDALLRWLKPGAAVWWMEDPMQNLYGRPALPLPGWVSLHSRTNYRSPHEILRYLNRMLPAAQAIEAGSPLAGFEVEIFTYADHDGLVATTKKALNRAISLGYKRKMIALVSYRGKQESALSGCEQLGNYRLKSFTGKYDLFGSPVYSPGDILFESVYRYKGQSAPCVVLTEIDFDTLDEKALRKLFVGITRATMKLLLVMSDRAAAKLGGYARS